MTRQQIIMTGVFVAQAVICIVKLAPRHEWAAYFFMIGLALAGAPVNVKVNVHLVTVRAATIMVDLLALWLFFYFSGGKVFWTEALTVTLFCLVVAPATVIFYKSLK